MKNLLLALTALLICAGSYAQLPKRIHASRVSYEMKLDARSSGGVKLREEGCLFEDVLLKEQSARIDKMIREAKSSVIDTDEIVRIPVVFHVLMIDRPFGGSVIVDDGYVSHYQLYSAVDNLNLQYRAVYGTPYEDSHDSKIEFYLANRDEFGAPMEGVRYYDLDVVPWLTDEERDIFRDNGVYGSGLSDVTFKTPTALDQDRYLNVWIVPEIDNNGGGGGIQGYAYFPTSSVVYGIVQLDNATGLPDVNYYDLNDNGALEFEEAELRYLKYYTDENDVLPHEFGHIFGLYHVFFATYGCQEDNCDFQGDRVCDTNPTPETTSCSFDGCPNPPNKNIMGYTSCRTELTEGQVIRMRQVINNSLTELTGNFEEVWVPEPTQVEIELMLDSILCPGDGLAEIRIKNTGVNTLTNLKLAYGSNPQAADTVDLLFSLYPQTYRSVKLPPVENQGPYRRVKVLEINGSEVSMPVISEYRPIGQQELTVEYALDCLAGQHYWEIVNTETGNTVFSREPYPNFIEDTLTDKTCLNAGSYEFRFIDMTENGWSSCTDWHDPNVRVYLNGLLCQELTSSDPFSDLWAFSTCNEVEGADPTPKVPPVPSPEPPSDYEEIRFYNTEMEEVSFESIPVNSLYVRQVFRKVKNADSETYETELISRNWLIKLP